MSTLSTPNIKSPLRYPGGKSRAVRFLQQYIPPCKEFRDVFFGGGSLSLHLLQQNPAAIYQASDLNYDLYCFWSSLKNEPAKLIGGIQQVYDHYRNRDGKQLFASLIAKRQQPLSDLHRGIDFYILNRITFSGVVDSGGYSAAAFTGRFTQSGIDRLQKLVPLLANIRLSHSDYSKLLEMPGDGVVLFLDPPYFSAARSKLYGKKGSLHTGFDHYALVEALKNCTHKWLITYDNSAHIRQLYKDYYQVEWQLQYGMTNKLVSTANEVLISNYNLGQAKEVHLSLIQDRLTAAG